MAATDQPYRNQKTLDAIFGLSCWSGWTTTTRVDHTPASVPASRTCRSTRSHVKTGIESPTATVSSPPLFSRGCIMNTAWNHWRHKPREARAARSYCGPHGIHGREKCCIHQRSWTTSMEFFRLAYSGDITWTVEPKADN